MRQQRSWARYVRSATEKNTARDTVGGVSEQTSGGSALPYPRRSARARRVGASWAARWRERITPASATAAATTRASTTTADAPRHTDFRLVPPAAAAWVAAACVTRLDAALAGWCAVLLVILAVGCGVGCFLAGPGRLRRCTGPCVVPVAVAALIAMSAAVLIGVRTAGPVLAAVQGGDTITAVLRATEDAQLISPDRFTGADRFLVEATLTSGAAKGARFTADTPVVVIGQHSWADISGGDIVRTAGVLTPTEPGDRAVALLLAATSPEVSLATERFSYSTHLRNRFVLLASRVAGEGGLLPGMVIGDRSSLDPAIEQNMQNTGLTHLTAVSGTNCSYLLAFVFLAARAMKLPRLAAAALGITALVGFVILVRPEPSVLRAAVMGGIGVVAVLTGRGRVPLALLMLTVVALLTIDPWLNGTYAFMLSVAACCGLILFGPVLAGRLGLCMPRPAAQLIAVPIAAQLFCAPILALLHPSQPLYSLPANLAATPVVPIVTILGMLAVALIAVTEPLAAAEPLAVPLVLIAGWGAGWVETVARLFSSAPGAVLPWAGGLWGALLTGALSLVVVLSVLFGPRLAAVHRRRRPESMSSGRIERQGDRPRVGGAALLLALGCAVGLVAVLLWPGARATTRSWQVAACDVGQGDAFLLRTGERSALLIDTGPEPDAVDACLDRLSITTVDALVLTHFHADHYGGIEGVFRDRTVNRILYSSSEPALPSVVEATAGSESAVADGSARGSEPERLVQGMTGEHGDGGAYGRVTWTALWPGGTGRPSSENNSSAVLEAVIVTPGGREVTMLLTGDLEEDAAELMLQKHPDLVERGVDILKVPHHGARNGGLDLARALSPQLALISAGRENDYGHPHPMITDGLSEANITVARTDQLGTFLVAVDDNRLIIHR